MSSPDPFASVTEQAPTPSSTASKPPASAPTNYTLEQRMDDAKRTFLGSRWVRMAIDSSHTKLRVDLVRRASRRGGYLSGGEKSWLPWGNSRRSQNPNFTNEPEFLPRNNNTFEFRQSGQQNQHTRQRQTTEPHEEGLFGGGFRLTRVWPFGPEIITSTRNGEDYKRKLASVGVGVDLDLSRGRVNPVLRVRSKVKGPLDAWLHMAPQPEMKLKGVFLLPWLPNKEMAILGEARLPFTRAGPDVANSRIGFQLMNPSNSGLHLSPDELRFDEKILNLSNQAYLRLGASCRFPSSFPPPPGARLEDMVALRLQRLCISTILP